MTREWKVPSDSTRTGSIQWDSSWPEFAKDEDRIELLGYLEERFGIPPSSFDEYQILKKGNSWWLIRKSAHLELASEFKVFACGIKAFQRVGRFLKPTTRLMQLFGKEANSCIVDVTAENLRSFVKGEGIPSDLETENGYVLLRFHGNYDLGLGLLIRGIVRSQIRKSDLQQISTHSLS
jgi:NOL1/NOP2/fmu family ribosome biogenesis protein